MTSLGSDFHILPKFHISLQCLQPTYSLNLMNHLVGFVYGKVGKLPSSWVVWIQGYIAGANKNKNNFFWVKSKHEEDQNIYFTIKQEGSEEEEHHFKMIEWEEEEVGDNVRVGVVAEVRVGSHITISAVLLEAMYP